MYEAIYTGKLFFPNKIVLDARTEHVQSTIRIPRNILCIFSIFEIYRPASRSKYQEFVLHAFFCEYSSLTSRVKQPN